MKAENRIFLLFTLLLLSLFSEAQTKQLFVQNWKKPKKEVLLRNDTLVWLHCEQKKSGETVFISYTGKILGCTDSSVFISPNEVRTEITKKTAAGDSRFRQTKTDTQYLTREEIPFSAIDMLSIVKKESATRERIANIAAITIASTLVLAPLVSVNHVKGTVNSSLYGYLWLGAVVLSIGNVIGMDGNSYYSLKWVRPDKPERDDYHLVAHP